jgi:hypothetical protein
VPHAGLQKRRELPRPVLTKGFPQAGDAHIPAGGAWRCASSRASARQDEVRNHSPQGASSRLSACTCQPVRPPWVVNRGGPSYATSPDWKAGVVALIAGNYSYAWSVSSISFAVSISES